MTDRRRMLRGDQGWSESRALPACGGGGGAGRRAGLAKGRLESSRVKTGGQMCATQSLTHAALPTRPLPLTCSAPHP